MTPTESCSPLRLDGHQCVRSCPCPLAKHRRENNTHNTNSRYDPLTRARAHTDEQRARRPHILVVHGDADDHIVFEGNAVRFHEEFGERSTMLALPGVKHGVMVDSVVGPFREFWVRHLLASPP